MPESAMSKLTLEPPSDSDATAMRLECLTIGWSTAPHDPTYDPATVRQIDMGDDPATVICTTLPSHDPAPVSRPIIIRRPLGDDVEDARVVGQYKKTKDRRALFAFGCSNLSQRSTEPLV
jgi:hypothetical protein